MARLVFLTGGARCGKSRYAQQRAEAHPGPLLYVATGLTVDDEMAARIERHRQERGPRWATLEEPVDPAGRLPQAAAGKSAVLFDCVTFWLTNLLLQEQLDETAILARVDLLLQAARALDGTLYLVSNEVGQGIVPENALARSFRDIAGRVNQRLAAEADEAWLLVAGLPLPLK